MSVEQATQAMTFHFSSLNLHYLCLGPRGISNLLKGGSREPRDTDPGLASSERVAKGVEAELVCCENGDSAEVCGKIPRGAWAGWVTHLPIGDLSESFRAGFWWRVFILAFQGLC